MNAARALFFLLLVFVNANVMLYLWKRRIERVQRARVARALVHAVRRELGLEGFPKPARLWLRSAS